MQILSYGGGVQTASLLVLNATGEVQPRATHALFADTGSELPGTYQHIEEWAKPYAAENEIEFVVVSNPAYGRLHEYQFENKHPMMPMYGSEGGILRRQCTDKFKIRPIRRWLRSQGVKQAIVQLGISWDEVHRAKDSGRKWVENRWPLLELRYTRAYCSSILESAGVPVPPKSACFICPFRRTEGWVEMRERLPELFKQAVDFEKAFEGEYLHWSRLPLDQAIGKQHMMFQNDECGGYCWV